MVVKAAEDMEERQVTVKSKPSKTYTFDRVFGTDSNQEMIYDEVVNPILSEVNSLSSSLSLSLFLTLLLP